MAKCPICLTNEADKKNVHMIPWFLIKKTITDRGIGVRGMDLSFTIDPSRFTRMYTGQSILPETIESFGPLNNFQKETTDPYSRDNLICVECERKISRLEAIFASQFSDKKIKANQSNPFLNGHFLFIDPKYSHSLYELFVQSIFYRCSIGRFDGFLLPPQIQVKIEENLRQAFLVPNFIKTDASESVPLLHSFPIITSTILISDDEDTTKGFISIANSRFPYFLIAGKCIFQLFEAEKHIKSTVSWNYGLNGIINPVEAYKTLSGKSHTILLGEDCGKIISKNLIEYFAEKKKNGLNKNIRECYKHLYGHSPNASISQYILRNYFIHLNNGETERDAFIHSFKDWGMSYSSSN